MTEKRGEQNSPKIKHAHPILQLRLLDIALKHSNLRLRQGLGTLGIQTAGVLHARAQTGGQDASADLVMLGVGGGGLDGDGPAAQEIHVVHLGLVGVGQLGHLDDVDALLQLLPDAAAQEEDGEVATIDDFLDQVICWWEEEVRL